MRISAACYSVCVRAYKTRARGQAIFESARPGPVSSQPVAEPDRGVTINLK